MIMKWITRLSNRKKPHTWKPRHVKGNSIRITVANDFSKTPGPRYRSEGLFSGQEFREDFLLPGITKAILLDLALSVDLDLTTGYATAFLEEAFGGLVRVNGVSKKKIRACLSLMSCEEPYLYDDIWGYINQADGIPESDVKEIRI